MGKVSKNIPFKKAVRTDTLTAMIRRMEIGDCLEGFDQQTARSIRSMAHRYGIKLVSATQDNGEVWFWRLGPNGTIDG